MVFLKNNEEMKLCESLGEEFFALSSYTFGNMIHSRRCLRKKKTAKQPFTHKLFISMHIEFQPPNKRQKKKSSSLFLLPHFCHFMEGLLYKILYCTLKIIFLFLKSIPFGLALAELCSLHWRGNPFPLFSQRAAPLKSQLAWLNSFPLYTICFWCNVGWRCLLPAPAIEPDPSVMFNVSVWLGLNLAKSSVLCFIWKPSPPRTPFFSQLVHSRCIWFVRLWSTPPSS